MRVSYISKKFFPHFLLSIVTTVGLARAIIAPPMKNTLTSNTIFAQDFQIANRSDNTQGLSLENILSFDEKLDGIIYIVKPWDNLSSIAYKFGTTISQIKQINNLKSDVLRPGQKLIIRSQPGIYYQVKEDTSWKDFAQKYKLDLKQLLSLNYVSDEDQILQKWDEIFLPLTQKEAIEKGLLPKPKPKPRPTYTQPHRSVTVTTSTSQRTPVSSSSRWSKVVKSYYRNPWIYNWFAPGHCTRFVAIKKFPYITDTKQKKLWHWNAKNWYDNAAAAGYPVGQTPKIGSIVVIRYGAPNYYYNYGHVWIVRDIDWKNKKLLIEEMNAKWRFIVTRRRIPMDNKIIGYIYYNLNK